MTDIKSKVITIANKKTSMRLIEDEWQALDFICEYENIRRGILLDLINTHKDKDTGLTNAVRTFELTYLHRLFAEKQEPNYANQKIKPVNAIFYAIKGIL